MQVMAGWKQAAGLGKTTKAREEATVLQTYLWVFCDENAVHSSWLLLWPY